MLQRSRQERGMIQRNDEAWSKVKCEILPNGVSNADSTTMDVDLGRIQVTLLDIGQDHHAESLVYLKHGNVVLVDACLFQALGHGQSRGDGEVNGCTGSISKGYKGQVPLSESSNGRDLIGWL